MQNMVKVRAHRWNGAQRWAGELQEYSEIDREREVTFLGSLKAAPLLSSPHGARFYFQCHIHFFYYTEA